MLKTPHLAVEENQGAASPRPRRLVVEENEHQAMVSVPHLVVEEEEIWDAQYFVPFDRVAGATLDGIYLDCTGQELAAMGDFIERRYVQVGVPDYHNAGELALFGCRVPEEIKWVYVHCSGMS